MKESVIIIGCGPVGIRAAEEISALNPEVSISLYGNESIAPYNRVLLSNYLAGQCGFDSLKITPKLDQKTQLNIFYQCAITAIDIENKQLKREDGEIVKYDKLILATGSHAHIPSIENHQLDGIFTLRTVADANQLRNRTSQHTIVLGGGLLGLETARALHDQGTKQVTVIDHSLSLMSRQLNKTAGDLLVEKVQSFGIQVILGNGVKKVLGDSILQGVQLRNGEQINCDTLVFAVGIRPNIELAKNSGIHTRHGIVVDEKLQTSEKDIYAVGECAEFNHLTYGIVAPGFEQARIMALNLSGKAEKYHGSILSTRLKVLDYPVFSMGRVGENEAGEPNQSISFKQADQGIYRHLLFHRGRLIGCIALGEWSELSRIRSAIEDYKHIWPWERKRFAKTGLIWAEQNADSVFYWPDSAVVCNCSLINRGQLDSAIKTGCKTVNELSQATKAGTTCGACSPLLAELLGTKPVATKAYKPLAVISFLALLAAVISFFPPLLPYQQTASVEWFYDQLWRDKLLKEISGYALLVCSLIVLTLSLRKRIKRFSTGDFAWWRIMHVLIGFLVLALLLGHTGFRFGHNLNFYLMSSFTALLLIGALAGLVIAVEHKLNPGLARKLRNQFLWGHILLFWPLPALLGFHILQTYYF